MTIKVAAVGFAVIVEEASQRWIDNRTRDGVDLLANLLGIVTATLALRWLGPMLRRSST